MGNRNKLKVFLSIVAVVLIVLWEIRCKGKHPTEYWSDLQYITATDRQGNVISVDLNDWCPANTFIGGQLYIHPISLEFRCDSIGHTVSDTMNIFNFSNTDVEITQILCDNPLTADPRSTVIPANLERPIVINFTLPDSNKYEGTIYIHNSSSDSLITTSFRGKGPWGIGWKPEWSYALGPAYPNPTTSLVRIPFSVPEEIQVSVRIINRYGETVRILWKEVTPIGDHSLVWNLRDDEGQEVSSGFYRCVCKAGSFSCHGDIQVQ